VAYRAPSERADEGDPEEAAIAELTRRCRRLRGVFHVPILLLGLVAGPFVYIALRDYQFETRGAHMPWLTGVVAFVPTFGGSLKLAPYVADFFVRRALVRWRAELATKYDLDLAQLAETTKLLE
jgi:hypothetical protein